MFDVTEENKASSIFFFRAANLIIQILAQN